ncbi:MAG: hypothetical protein ACKVUS_12640 [Saprospiraceae bacterium]
MEHFDPTAFQRKFFRQIIALQGEKSAIPRLCNLLHLNKSSVYNRVKAEKMLRSDELLLLASTFGISIDEHLFAGKGIIPFRFDFLDAPVQNCRQYLERVLASFDLFKSVPDLRVWFLVNSLPFFHHMNFRELALFKAFAYARVNWQLPYTEGLVFHPDNFPEREVYEKLMKPILERYTAISTIEFWPDDLYHTTLRQIRYFAHSGQLADQSLISLLLEQLEALCEHQYEMAKMGRKWAHADRFGKEGGKGGRFDLYHNEVAPLNITLLAESKQLQGVFTVFDDPNFMFSSSARLYQYTFEWMQKLKSKCQHISEDSENDRRAYFNALQKSIAAA